CTSWPGATTPARSPGRASWWSGRSSTSPTWWTTCWTSAASPAVRCGCGASGSTWPAWCATPPTTTAPPWRWPACWWTSRCRAGRHRERSRGGLGLGLALVKGLAELHHGGVWVASDGPGRGSEFGVWLPLAPERAPAAAGARDAGPVGKALRVLVVEDNADAAE